MDDKEIFRKLTFGTRFDLKRFQADAEKLKIGRNLSGADSSANCSDINMQHAVQWRSDSRQAVHQSMSTLKQTLEDRSVVQQFQKLYVEKPGLTMNAAVLATNEHKNRYRDVLPYDSTRVVLSGGEDYINASHITMTMPVSQSPSSQVVGRYIGSQGPLPHTVADFWRMVWEQHVHLLMMLTAETEGRRVKCHRYWPQCGAPPVSHKHLTVSCTKEHKTSTGTVRDFQLTNNDTKEVRTVRQLQYTSWPDHGVPSDCRHFLEFVGVVRREIEERSTGSRPTLVHCSAGVGRTGVLIGMLTAWCYIKAVVAVDMLAVVRQMRDQRPVLIQTPEQFVFLCQAVLAVYNNEVAGENQNNSAAVIRREIGDEAEHDGDLTDDHETKQITASNLKRSLSVLSDAIDQSPRRKKKKKSSERLTQIRLEEVNHFRNQHHIHVYGTDVPEPIATFEELQTEYSIDARIMSNLQSLGFHTPTVIEMQAIPVMLHRRELTACAPTGSGKTLAFVLPLLHHLQGPRSGGVRAVILSPTIELAEQTLREINRVGEGLGLHVHFIRKASNDIKKCGSKLLQKFDILVTTPNRLIHLLQDDASLSLSLSSVEWLVIDESDKLFEDGKTGFRDQLAVIYKACDSKDVRRAMFSATFSYDVEEWCRLNLDNVVQVCVGARNTVAPTIEQELLYVGDESGKLLAIRDIIRKGFQPPMLVFMQSKDRAKDLFHELVYDGINVDVIHADRTPQQRDAVVRGFRSGCVWVLICTDVMCRGMDFKGINLVVNYDFPNSDYVYIHRIGRTGRAGRPGKAVTFFTDTDTVNLRCIANKMREAGCSVPDYMLQMKLPSRSLKKKLKKSAPVRDDIRTDSALVKNKKRAFKRSKERRSNAPSTSTSNSGINSALSQSDSPSAAKPKTKKLKLDKTTGDQQ